MNIAWCYSSANKQLVLMASFQDS